MRGNPALLRGVLICGLLFAKASLHSQIYVDTIIEFKPLKGEMLMPLWTRQLHHRVINCMALSADGKKLITGGATGIKILTLKDTGFEISHSFRPFKTNYSNITWSQDNKHYFIGSYGGFQVYNAGNNSLYYNYTFPAADNWVQDAFTNHKNVWLITDWHSKARVYSLKQNKIIRTFTDTPESAGFASGMNHLAASLRFFLADSIRMPGLAWDRGATNSLIIDTIARTFVFNVNQGNSRYLCLWNYKSGRFTKIFGLPSDDYLIGFRLVRYVNGSLKLYYSCSRYLYCIDLKTNTTKILYQLPFEGQLINSIEVDTNSGHILLGTEDRSGNKKPYLICLKYSASSSE